MLLACFKCQSTLKPHTPQTLYLYDVFHSASRVPLNVTLYPDQWLQLCGEAVRHQFKVAVGRHKRDGTVILEARETHTLVELHVLQLNCLGT